MTLTDKQLANANHNAIVCVVRYSGGTYATSRVQGQQASATVGAEQAVQRLALKLAATGVGPQDPTVHQVDQATGNSTIAGCGTWEIRPRQVAPLLVTTALNWLEARHVMPDSDIRVLIWFGNADSVGQWASAWFDGEHWRLCESGGIVDGCVLYWAIPLGPGKGESACA